MAIDDAFRIEVDTLHSILDSLDYYRMLKIKPDARPLQIRNAFFRESKIYHPDRYFAIGDTELKVKILDIYKRISEAYACLKDPDTRALYDRQRQAGGPLRLDPSKRDASAPRSKGPKPEARTVKGRKFMAIAQDCLRRGDMDGAVMNLQFALNAEPDNALIRERLEQTQAKRKADSTPNYRVRLP